MGITHASFPCLDAIARKLVKAHRCIWLENTSFVRQMSIYQRSSLSSLHHKIAVTKIEGRLVCGADRVAGQWARSLVVRTGVTVLEDTIRFVWIL